MAAFSVGSKIAGLLSRERRLCEGSKRLRLSAFKLGRAASTLARLPGVDLDFSVESAVHNQAGPGAPWAVCFHSSGLGARQWAPGPQLAPNLNWLAVNFCGYDGSTAWPRGQRAPSLADQAALVCSAVDSCVPAGASVNLLGHSYGGSVALAASDRLVRTHRVASLVLFEPNAFFLLPDARAFAPEVRGWLDLQRSGRDDDFMSAFYAFWFGGGAWEVLPKRTAKKLRETLRDLDLELIATLAEIEHAASAERYGALLNGPLGHVPKAVMHGTLGTHARTLELLERLRAHCGFSMHETTALGAGHLAPFTHSAIVLPEMLALAQAQTAKKPAS